MITYVNLSAGEQARRDQWRLALKADPFDFSFFNFATFEGWATRVEAWRAKVDAGEAIILAATSAPALDDKLAVIDVRVIGGAEAGVSVSQVLTEMNKLGLGVQVFYAERTDNADAAARGALLTSMENGSNPNVPKDCGPLGLKCVTDDVYKVVKLALVAVIVVAVAYGVAKVAPLFRKAAS